MTTKPKGLTDAEIVAIRDDYLPSQGEPFDCIAFARAVIAAGAASVPREPTAGMFIAGSKALAMAEGSFARHVWYAMYDAAREGK